ncbi:MAG: class I SAM-dependent methyltransferase [Desulfurococcaceae archaeon]
MRNLVKPEVYDKLHGEEQYVKYNCIVNHGVVFKGTIIDIGCGTGLLYEFIEKQQRAFKGRYICIDPDEKMLKIARKKLNTPLAILVKSRAEELPIRSDSGDVVVSISTWGLLEKTLSLLREFKHVARKTGAVVITGHPRTYDVSPSDLDSDFKFIDSCIDNIYMYRKES